MLTRHLRLLLLTPLRLPLPMGLNRLADLVHQEDLALRVEDSLEVDFPVDAGAVMAVALALQVAGVGWTRPVHCHRPFGWKGKKLSFSFRTIRSWTCSASMSCSPV